MTGKLRRLFSSLIGCALIGSVLSVIYVGDGFPALAISREGGLTNFSDENDGRDWPAYGQSFGEQHFSALKQVNQDTIRGLKLDWFLDLPPGNAATIPLAVDGILYLASGQSVVRAVNAVTGRQLWEFDPKVGDIAGERIRGSWGTRGIAYWKGRVYVATLDGRLLAIDAKTGRQIWGVTTVSPGDGRYITGAPRVFDGKVIIGHAGADVANVRGYVTTYDAATGKQLWRFFTVPGNPALGFEDEAQKMAAKTWTGDWWEFGGGGTVWNAMTYDAETDTVLIGVGNGAPWNHRVRSPQGGDNLFLCSIVALDAKTGRYKWHYQINPGETWDYNAAMDIALGDILIDGKSRKVAMTAPKNGFFYVIDRLNGKLISAEKITKVTWASKIDPNTGRPVEVAGARFPNGQSFEMWPGMWGAHSWMPMAFDPRNQIAYIPKLMAGANYNDRGIDTRNWKRAAGNVVDVAENFDFNVDDPQQNTSYLLAWDPRRQAPLWEVKTVGNINGGVMATAGNLVFQGQIDGRFSAYAGESGRELWNFMAQAPIISAPITYSARGRQYITVIVGMGAAPGAWATGGMNVDYVTQKRRILTFSLNGTARLPVDNVAIQTEDVEDPDYQADEKLAKRGDFLYHRSCVPCHGPGVVSAGGAPDLRRSVIPQSLEAFDQVVRKGALTANGMPKFDEISDQDLLAIRQYLRQQRALIPKQ